MPPFDPANPIAERNLIFAGVALEKGWIQSHHISHAFTIWVCNKEQHLGDILVELKILTEEQKQEIDQEVARKKIQNQGTVLSGLESLDDLADELNFLDDSDLSVSLDNAQKDKGPNWRFYDSSKGQKDPGSGGSDHRTPHGKGFGRPGDYVPGSDRFEPVDYLNSQGGMGELWIARDKELNRYVIVKYIKRFRASDALHRGLFQLEGEVTGHLEHPNIPPVYSLSKDSLDRDYFAMRYFKGKKLTDEIRAYHAMPYRERGARKEKLVELLQAFQTACLTVEFAHNRGVIHCDLKPDNIMIGDYGETLVIDWGLVVIKGANLRAEADAETETFHEQVLNQFNPSKSASSGLHVKQGGSRKSVGGTLAYMPPEQLQATELGDVNLITTASDVFGLGATLYHLLVGHPPYLPKTKERETKTAYFERIRKGQFPPPRVANPELPKPLASILAKAMNATPENRYATARDLADDVRRWLSNEPTQAHPENFLEKGARWIKRHSKTVIATGTVSVCFFGLYLFSVITEKAKTTAALKLSVELLKKNFRHMQATEPFFSRTPQFLDLKKQHLYYANDKMDELIQTGLADDDFLYDHALNAVMIGNIWRYEGKFDESRRFYKKGLESLAKVQKTNVPGLLGLLRVQMRRDLNSLNLLGGQTKEFTTLFEENEKDLDSFSLTGILAGREVDEKILMYLDFLEAHQYLSPDPKTLKRVVAFAKTHASRLDKVDWTKAKPHDILLLNLVTRSLLQNEKENPGFESKNLLAKLPTIFQSALTAIKSDAYQSESLPKIDFESLLFGSLLDYFHLKSPIGNTLNPSETGRFILDRISKTTDVYKDIVHYKILRVRCFNFLLSLPNPPLTQAEIQKEILFAEAVTALHDKVIQFHYQRIQVYLNQLKKPNLDNRGVKEKLKEAITYSKSKFADLDVFSGLDAK